MGQRRLTGYKIKIGPRLLWKMNRKSLIPDRSLSVPMTLSDLERQDTRNPAYQSIFIYARSYRLTDGDKIGHGLGEGRFIRGQVSRPTQGVGPALPHFWYL